MYTCLNKKNTQEQILYSVIALNISQYCILNISNHYIYNETNEHDKYEWMKKIYNRDSPAKIETGDIAEFQKWYNC
jgi:hypothetical protein